MYMDIADIKNEYICRQACLATMDLSQVYRLQCKTSEALAVYEVRPEDIVWVIMRQLQAPVIFSRPPYVSPRISKSLVVGSSAVF